MPASSASWIAATELLSSWAPQPNSPPEPPMAQAPNPIGVMNRSELPNRLVFMIPLLCDKLTFPLKSVLRLQLRRSRAKSRPALSCRHASPEVRCRAGSNRLKDCHVFLDFSEVDQHIA